MPASAEITPAVTNFGRTDDVRKDAWEQYAAAGGFEPIRGLNETAAMWDVLPIGLQRSVMPRLIALVKEDVPLRWTDLGTGDGFIIDRLRKPLADAGLREVEVDGIDLAEKFLALAQTNLVLPAEIASSFRIRLVQANLVEGLPFYEYGTRHLITANYISPYVSAEEQRRLFGEAQRVLVPGGIFAVGSFVTGEEGTPATFRAMAEHALRNEPDEGKRTAFLEVMPQIAPLMVGHAAEGRMYNPTMSELNNWLGEAGFSEVVEINRFGFEDVAATALPNPFIVAFMAVK